MQTYFIQRDDDLLTAEQAAQLVSVSYRTIWEWEATKKISAIRVSRVIRFRRGTLLAELARFSTAATSGNATSSSTIAA